ncbi:uncharacterized protein [Battus philenor]|uniref:uncharacterized protein n=1 Tax=Battus philenor TaxID=42288 RepID=UPI0035D05008
MARLAKVILGALALQIVYCAPSNHKEESSILDQSEPTLNDKLYSVLGSDEITDSNKETQRQKRWYDNAPYYPPPFIRRYDTRSEIENSLSYIQLRLQEILNIAKTPPPPPPPSVYPIYIPIYIPQVQCGCNPTNNVEPSTEAPKPTTTTKPVNDTVPKLNERFPEMEDERQNWGLVVNNTLTEYDDDDDGARPISLTPIIAGSENERPAPPVDHGSSQADVNNINTQSLSTENPFKTEKSASQPSVCDRAIMGCCFGTDPSFRCIQSRGCRDRALSINPCNQQYLLGVINRLQNFYG